MCGAIFRRGDFCRVCDRKPDVSSTTSGSDNPGQSSEERQGDGLLYRHAELSEAGDELNKREGLPRQDGRTSEGWGMPLKKTTISSYVGSYVRATARGAVLTSLEINQGDGNWVRVFPQPSLIADEISMLINFLKEEQVEDERV